jgi:O-acetyl-ADP-ribose deacetylase (regulator of RNase III)
MATIAKMNCLPAVIAIVSRWQRARINALRFRPSAPARAVSLDRATAIAVGNRGFPKRNNSVKKIIFVCFGKAAYDAYHAALNTVST